MIRLGARPRIAIAALGCALLAYVLPADRVLEQLARARTRLPPLRVEVTLEGHEDWPARARLDLHAERGVRIEDERGGRWLVRGQRVEGEGSVHDSLWVPDAEILVIRSEAALIEWLLGAGVDLDRSDLGRCDPGDCFVIGGRDAPAQLWVDKDRFEVRQIRTRDGRSVRFDEYQEWDGLRFPSRIAIESERERLALLVVEAVAAAPELDRADFSRRWLEHPASPAPR